MHSIFSLSDQLPKIHLDLADLNIANLASTDLAVFNPALANTARFANIVKYLRNVNTEMTAADFKAGTIYNMEVELIPMLTTTWKIFNSTYWFM